MTRLVEQQAGREVENQEDMPSSPKKETNMKQTLRQSNVSDSDYAQANGQDSESDVPISSDEWPSSPIQHTRNQLPSDSSTETAKDIHSHEQEPPNTSKEALSPVRNEENNLGTKSTAQEYPSAQAPSLQSRCCPSSKASQEKVTESSNPNSTEDESCQYVCELPGCSQAFNKRRGLNYHLLHHHNLTPRSKDSRRMLTSTASTIQGDSQKSLSQNSQRKSSGALEASSSQLLDSKLRRIEPREEIIDLTQQSDGNNSYTDSAEEPSDREECELRDNLSVLSPNSESNHLEEKVSHTGDIAQAHHESPEADHSTLKFQTSHQDPTQIEARSSSPESTLETAVPRALCETEKDDFVSFAPPAKRRRLDISQPNFKAGYRPTEVSEPQTSISTKVDTEQSNGSVIDMEKLLEDQSANPDETVFSGKCMPSTDNILSKAWSVSTNDTSAKSDRKRKPSGSAIPSPNTWKRRRHQRRLLGLDFSQGTADMPDPSIMARRYREEFLASRKNSLSESYDSPSCMSSVNGTPDRKLNLRSNVQPDAIREQEQNRMATKSVTPIASPPVHFLSPSTLKFKDRPDLPSEITGVQEYQHLHEHENAKALPSAHEEYTGIDVSSTAIPSTKLGDMPVLHPLEASKPSDFAADTTAGAPERPRSETRETDLDAVSQKLQAVSSDQVSQNSTKAAIEPTLSGVQAQSLPELMTPALSITDVEPVQSSGPFFEMQADRSHLPSSSIFEQFRTTYPEYSGTFRHFVGMCKKIESLCEADRMEHMALWDDFIVRHNTEYPRYLSRCTEAVEDSLPYEKYYRSEIEKPAHTKHVVTPKNLSQILASESPPNASGSLTRSDTSSHSKADIGPHLQQEQNQIEVMTKETSRQQGKDSPDAVFQCLEKRRQRRSHLSGPTVGCATVVISQNKEASPSPVEHCLNAKNEKAAATIDLTGDDILVPESPPWGTVESPTLSAKKPSRRLPWVSSEDTVTPIRRGPVSKMDSAIVPKTRHDDLEKSANTIRAPNSAPSKLFKLSSKPNMRNTSLPRTSSFCRSKRATESSSKKRFEVKGSTPIIEMQLVESIGIDGWWKDENSPFNIFRRKYMAITPGKGNSYAQDQERESGKIRGRDRGEHPSSKISTKTTESEGMG
ncbi:MAG: hypothetical protein Q9167_003249 [Letrouitia subvulpina]